MSVDVLQDKIRKVKNPSVLELSLSVEDLPDGFSQDAAGYGGFCRELLTGLKGIVPAVRFGFASFALLGAQGLSELKELLSLAGEMGFYVLLDAPEIWSVSGAEQVARAVFSPQGSWPCDGLVIPGYLGSDAIKPFLPYCKSGKKDIFVVVRTANKSAPELQDLLSGTRLVHLAAADHVNRYAGESVGKSGYSRVGVMAGASAADSLRNIRIRYPRLFLLVEGYDYPNSNAKNCSFAFDKFGHGAAVCAGRSIACAWKEAEPDTPWLSAAADAAERMKKNLTRYVSIL